MTTTYATWRAQNPNGSWCGQEDPNAYCLKPCVRGCDYHSDLFLEALERELA